MEAVPSFALYSEDGALAISSVGSSGKQSKLDELLLRRWGQAMSNGVFRYDLSGVATRQVPGEFGFIVQCNTKRHTHRRQPAEMSSLRQPYDPTLFNFNNVKPEEVLFELKELAGVVGHSLDVRSMESGEVVCKRHLVVVNVSPITHGHSLLIPDPSRCLPQVLTEDSIRLCLDLVAISNNSGFTIVANSLLAYASVNHLHYHILYVTEPVLAARVEGKHIARHMYELTNHPVPGFGFQLSASTRDCARDIFSVVNHLLGHDVPHNLVIVKGTPFTPMPSDAPSSQVVRAILTPRQPHYGGKTWPSTPPPLCAAACELAQGFIPVLDETKYHTLTEKEILEILQEKSFSKENFQSLLEDIKKSLGL